MKTYNVEWDESVHYSCYVEASSEHAAINKVKKEPWNFVRAEEYMNCVDNFEAEGVE